MSETLGGLVLQISMLGSEEETVPAKVTSAEHVVILGRDLAEGIMPMGNVGLTFEVIY